MPANIVSASAFIRSVQLPPAPERDALGVDEALQAGKTNATVVGSDVISFASVVNPEMRQAIIDSALLAQLAATHKVPDKSKIFEWFDVYFDTLGHVGWFIQDHGFANFTESAEGLEAHQAVLDIAAGLLGKTSSAFQLVKTALDSLMHAQGNEPFFVIFNRETKQTEMARFQISVAEAVANADGETFTQMITVVAFGMKASSTLTQVLLVKLRSGEAEFKQRSGKVTIAADVLEEVYPLIQQRILAHQRDFIVDLPI